MGSSGAGLLGNPAGARVTTQPDHTVIWLSGEHDLASIELLEASMCSAVEDHDDDVVVDLAALEFMDASTLGSVLRFRSRLAAQGRRLTMRAAPRCARLVLEACDLVHLIEPGPVADGGPDRRAPTALQTWVKVPREDEPGQTRVGAPTSDV
ncbi:MAG: STAS domain-containing protein [Acidimicrobiales bacterium]|nr:STAS domain-containing protein [Acidimicrobiales bacterium]